MLDCPRCTSQLDLTVRDCRRCGADARPAIPAGVGLVCRGCGTFHDPGHAWCSACGRPLADVAPAQAAENAAALVPPPTSATASPPRLRVVVVRPGGARGALAAIGPGPIVCGRSGGLEIDDPAVAPTHLRLTPSGDIALAEDLGGRAGTFMRVRGAVTLATASEIRIGRQRLRLELRQAVEAGSGPGLLVQLWPDGRAKAVFPLRSGVNLLGRDIGDVSFPADRSVSARHARLTVGRDEATLEDVGSSNGTFVRLTATSKVQPGDQLLIGNQLLCIERIDDDAAARSA